MTAAVSSRVLGAYKELLSLIKRLPRDQQSQALIEARHKIRTHAAEKDAARQLELFKDLCAKISYLRVVTPRTPGVTSSIGAGHYVLRDGELVPGTGASTGSR